MEYTEDQLRSLNDSASRNVKSASEFLNALCAEHKNDFGIVSDSFRMTAEYKAAKLAYIYADKSSKQIVKMIPSKLLRKWSQERRFKKA